jgi:hypothetical protein
MATAKFGGEIIHEYKQFEIDGTDITFSETENNGSARAGVGLAVTVVSTGADEEQIELAGDGDQIAGRLESVSKGKLATVAVRGSRMKFKGGASATLTRGGGIVGDLGASSAKGYVRSPATAATVTEAHVQEAGRTRGCIVDNDATDPIVMFSY